MKLLSLFRWRARRIKGGGQKSVYCGTIHRARRRKEGRLSCGIIFLSLFFFSSDHSLSPLSRNSSGEMGKEGGGGRGVIAGWPFPKQEKAREIDAGLWWEGDALRCEWTKWMEIASNRSVHDSNTGYSTVPTTYRTWQDSSRSPTGLLNLQAQQTCEKKNCDTYVVF